MTVGSFLALPSMVRAESTLAEIRKAGFLTCGVIEEDAEYSTEDDHGSRGQFDYDICRAIASASIGPKATVKAVVFLDTETAIAALRAGEVEVVASMSVHPAVQDVHISRPILSDGVGFLVPRSAHILHARDLAGHKVCFLAETEVEVSLQSWSAKEHLDFLPFPFQEEGEMEAAYITNNCAAIAGDLTRLLNTLSSFGSIAGNYMLLPEVISSDPLATATRAKDIQWSSLADSVIALLITCEESGVTSANVEAMKISDSPSAIDLRARAKVVADRFGLQNDWLIDTVKSTGNFGEIYARTFGETTMLRRQ